MHQLKPLRSCSRCRKNKVKCDSAKTRPAPCTPCAKKGLVCTLDYVVPPRRSDQLKSIHQSVAQLKHCVDRLLHDSLLSSDKQVTWQEVKKTLSVPSKVIKVADSTFIRLLLTHSELLFNDVEIELSQVETVLQDFLETMKKVLPPSSFSQLPPLLDLTYTFTCATSEPVLFLITILNFYFDIPNFDYLQFYDYAAALPSASQLWLFSNVVLYGIPF